MKTHLDTAIVALALGTLALACAPPEDPETTSEPEVLGARVAQPIVNGTPATAYTEAALVNGPDFICSGAVIAPRLVLTAGHCVVGTTSWTIKAPYAGNQTATGKSAWTDYVEAGEFVNPSTLDVAVIILDKPITLSTYPTLASTASANGTSAVNVGRIRNGQASYTGLFFGSAVTLQAGASQGFPKSYIATDVIEPGDSGGPVYVGSGASRSIVAVNSGGGGTEVLARVDLAYAKIQQLIAANGGSGAAASTPAPAPAPTPAPACAGTPEVEPNDASNAANPLAGTRCGALATSGDVDWYGWSVGGSGVAYDVALTTTGDAEILMWKWNGTAWSPISNASPTHIKATSSGPGNYVIAARSASGTPQSYALKLTK